MAEKRFAAWTDMLVRLGYHPIKKGSYSPSKVKQMELLAFLFGTLDVAQVCRSEIYPSRYAVYVAFSQAKQSGTVLSPSMLEGTTNKVYSIVTRDAKAQSEKTFLDVLAPVEQVQLQQSRLPEATRIHELYGINAAIAMVYSSVPMFQYSINHTLFRGVSTIKDLLEKQDNYGRPFNQLAPDLCARFERGACFVEIDRGMESTRIFNRKVADYLETLRSISPDELCATAALFACFGDKKKPGTMTGRKSSTSKSGVDLLAAESEAAAASRKDLFSVVCDDEALRDCAERGLRLMIVPGDKCWSPSAINKMLRTETGILQPSDSLIAFRLGRSNIPTPAYGFYDISLRDRTLRFPTAILPNRLYRADSYPIIVEDLSADVCAKRRVMELLSFDEYITAVYQNEKLWSFFLLDVESVHDAAVFMDALERNIRGSHKDNDGSLIADLLSQSTIYELFGVSVSDAGTFEFTRPYQGFIFRCRDTFFLPKRSEAGRYVSETLRWEQSIIFDAFSF